MVEIKFAGVDDLERIAACHREAFPGSLSSALGIDYVTTMLKWYLSTETTFLFFLEEDKKCLGYCGGMVKRVWGVGSASSMAQYSYHAAVVNFLKRPWLIFHPEIRAKFSFIMKNIINRFLKKEKLRGEPDVVFEPYSALVVIGVDPVYQGKGFGSMLIREFELITFQKGLKKMVLSVVSDNEKAVSSYSRNSWIITKVNGKSTSMEKTI